MLDEVNRVTGRAWRTVRPFDAGWQGGASLIEDDDGPAVLKVSTRATAAAQVAGAAPLVAAVRAVGYPTPAWIDHGVLADGSSFVVQDFVDGHPITTMTHEILDSIFDLVALERTIRFDVARTNDLNAHTRAYAFGESGTAAQLTARGGTVADAVARALRLARPYADAALVGDQMVHGDISMDNLIMRGSEIVGAVDIEGIGSGCATLDLLTTARQDYMWGDASFGARILEECLRADGAPVVAIGVAAVVIDILAFGLDHWPAEDVDDGARSMIRWVTDVEAAL